MTCQRKHIGAAGLIFDEIAGRTHCLYGFKYQHPSGAVGWEFPGGKQDPDESAEEAVTRECLEETGLIISQPQFITFSEGPDFICLLFAARPVGGELKLCEPHKHREWRWFPADEPPPQPLIWYVHDAMMKIGELYGGQLDDASRDTLSNVCLGGYRNNGA